MSEYAVKFKARAKGLAGLFVNHEDRAQAIMTSYRTPNGTFAGTNPWTKHFSGSPHQTSKTHCKYGHPLSGDNLYLIPRVRGDYEYTERTCKVCILERQRVYRARKAAA